MAFNISRMNLSERDIEDWLFENPEMCRYGDYWCIDRWFGRQYRLPSGIADLVGVTSQGCVAVVEVKNVPADGKAIAQVCRYAYDLKNVMGYRWDYECRDANGPVIQKIVVAPSISDVNTYFEADALQVTLLEFKVSLHVDIYAAYPDSRQDLDRYHEHAVSIHDIAQNPEWDMFGPYSTPGDQFRAIMEVRREREMTIDGGDAEHF